MAGYNLDNLNRIITLARDVQTPSEHTLKGLAFLREEREHRQSEHLLQLLSSINEGIHNLVEQTTRQAVGLRMQNQLLTLWAEKEGVDLKKFNDAVLEEAEEIASGSVQFDLNEALLNPETLQAAVFMLETLTGRTPEPTEPPPARLLNAVTVAIRTGKLPADVLSEEVAQQLYNMANEEALREDHDPTRVEPGADQPDSTVTPLRPNPGRPKYDH